jgi:hypothetical protein
MSILHDCLSQAPALSNNPELVAGCFQAQASIDAAYITFKTGGFAIVAALLGILAVPFGAWMTDQSRRKEERRNFIDRRARTANVYIAEIISLHNFLDTQNALRETLKIYADQNAVLDASETQTDANREDINIKDTFPPSPNRKRVYFHPGNNWLMVYQKDPTSIELFDADVAGDVVSYCCRMINELGRLRWMHSLPQREIDDKPAEWLSDEQRKTLNNLNALEANRQTVVKKLMAYRGPLPPRRPRSLCILLAELVKF